MENYFNVPKILGGQEPSVKIVGDPSTSLNILCRGQCVLGVHTSPKLNNQSLFHIEFDHHYRSQTEFHTMMFIKEPVRGHSVQCVLQ